MGRRKFETKSIIKKNIFCVSLMTFLASSCGMQKDGVYSKDMGLAQPKVTNAQQTQGTRLPLLLADCGLSLENPKYSYSTLRASKDCLHSKKAEIFDAEETDSVYHYEVGAFAQERYRKQIKVNFIEESIAALNKATGPSQERQKAENNSFDLDQELNLLSSKYQTLEKIFAKEAAEGPSPRVTWLNGLDYDFDMPYNKPYNSAYHPLVLREVNKVFNDFGRLYVNAMDKPKAVWSKTKPWAGYWYPFRSKKLYEPLAAWEQLLKQSGHDNNIVEIEKDLYDRYDADNWEGLCDAMSIAATVTIEPTKTRKVSGVDFSIAHQKALLTFSHLKYPYKQYGITYRGDVDTDGTYQDIKPEAFHKLVMEIIGKQRRAFVIDETPGFEVWNKPLFRYRWQVMEDPENKDFAFLVKGFPYLVKQRSAPSEMLTSDEDTIAPMYEYRLYVDKSVKDSEGNYLVVAGQWLRDSRGYHPGNVKVPETSGSLGSHNPEFNKYLKHFERNFVSRPKL